MRPSFLSIIPFCVLVLLLGGCWAEIPYSVAEPPGDDKPTEDGGGGEGIGHQSSCDSDELFDCNGVCAPKRWIADGYCDDGTYWYEGHAIHLDCAEYDWDGGDCPAGDEPEPDPEPDPTGPAWEDDCTPGLNETIATASTVLAIDDSTYDGELCAGDTDVFVLEVPAGSWASVEIDIAGSGGGSTDLDLYELRTDGQAYQNSYTTNSYERVAVYNQTDAPREHWFQVLGYQGATASYEVIVNVSAWHFGMECDDFYGSSSSESGPCNWIMQFPRANGTFEAVYPEHKAAWSAVRREVAYLVRWAGAEVMDQFPNTRPLGLLDMSEKDGATPGTLQGDLRHPSGTHINGNDIDIAYYQNDGANNGEVVCPSNDGRFCTGAATKLDAERTAYFLAKLAIHPETRVIGVDPVVGEDVMDAADDLYAADVLSTYERNRLHSKVTWGGGWPFHHHHLHFSWHWEGGWTATEPIPDGCIVEPSVVERPAKVPAF